MTSMAESKRVGMFLVNSIKFRDACLPFPQRIVSSISLHLPKISCTRNEALLKTIKVIYLYIHAKLKQQFKGFVQHAILK